jgi:hypothetical protein
MLADGERQKVALAPIAVEKVLSSSPTPDQHAADEGEQSPEDDRPGVPRLEPDR